MEEAGRPEWVPRLSVGKKEGFTLGPGKAVSPSGQGGGTGKGNELQVSDSVTVKMKRAEQAFVK